MNSNMSGTDTDIHIDELKLLLDTCSRTCYKVTESDPQAEDFVYKCVQLFAKDYTFSTLNNPEGELCPHYPSSIVLTESAKGTILENNNRVKDEAHVSIDPVQFTELLQKSRFARYRTHFPVPVIQFEGKRICRSATLAESPDNYSESELSQFYHIRDLDLRVLNAYSIGHICDLMVEKTKIKFGIKVASSEKIDKHNRYSKFTFSTIPYPGCEYFTEWRLTGYKGELMYFNWNQEMVDVDLELPAGDFTLNTVDWTNYKHWNLIELTQNYLKLFLHYIVTGDKGLLIHCISGWHRTPMFISLLRLSLWADMEIHQSLGPLDILYLTIAYDWFLFGHNFQCLVKGEDIFVFCFHFLNYITSEEFSVSSFKKNSALVNGTGDSLIETSAQVHKPTTAGESREKPAVPNKSVPVHEVGEATKGPLVAGVLDGGDMFYVNDDSPRKQRLDAVRKIFLNNFRGANGQKIPEDPKTLHQQMKQKEKVSPVKV